MSYAARGSKDGLYESIHLTQHLLDLFPGGFGSLIVRAEVPNVAEVLDLAPHWHLVYACGLQRSFKSPTVGFAFLIWILWFAATR